MKKLTTLLLLLAMLAASVLPSCGDKANETDANADTTAQSGETAATEQEVDLYAAYRSIDLGGRTVKISVSENVTEGGGGMPTSYQYIAGPEELTGESVQDNVFERNGFVEELLNVELEYQPLNLEYNEVAPHIEKLVTAGDADVDYYVNDQLGLLSCALKGYLLDCADSAATGESYFNFDSDAYYSDYMSGLSLGGKRFLITGDYFIDTMRAGHVLYLNKNLYTTIFGDPADLYNLVLDKKWTMDKFIETIGQAYSDINGNGSPDEEDQFGLAIHAKGWNPAYPYYPFYYSTDAHVVDFDENQLPYINVDNLERVNLAADKLIAIQSSSGTLETASVADSLKQFISGKTLFTAFSKVGDIEHADVRNFDGMGVVPYPLLDETQEIYRTLVHDTAEMGALPITTVGEAATAASAVIEVMSVHAHANLLPDYYETALKIKYSQDEYTPQMLDLIVAGISAPFEFAYELGFGTDSYLNGISFQPVGISISKGTNVTASEFESRLSKAETRIELLIETYK